MAKVEAMAKVFEPLDQLSIKSEADVTKKNPVVQSRAVEGDIGDYQSYLGKHRSQQRKHVEGDQWSR